MPYSHETQSIEDSLADFVTCSLVVGDEQQYLAQVYCFCVYKNTKKLMLLMYGKIPNLFDCWADLLLKSSMSLCHGTKFCKNVVGIEILSLHASMASEV